MAKIHESLIRPVLIGESQVIPTIILYVCVGILLLAFPWTRVSVSISLLLLFSGHGLLIWFAYNDPDWWSILVRHVQQQDAYLAGNGPPQRKIHMLMRETEEQHFADLLPYDTLATPGVMLCKNLSLMAAYTYTGPDLEVATDEELQGLSNRINTAIRQLGDGWTMQTDLFRYESREYPEEGAFPDVTSRLIDQERREQYQAEGQHYECVTCVTITYQPPKETTKRLRALFTVGNQKRGNMNENVRLFEHGLTNMMDMLGGVLRVERLTGADLLTYLHRCLTGASHRVTVPNPATYLDSVLASQDFISGFYPQVGNKHVRVMTITGFPMESRPAILAVLGSLPCIYRWNTRFIFLSPHEARKVLSRARSTWDANLYGVVDKIIAGMTKEAPHFENLNAKTLAEDANLALSELEAGVVQYGYYTSVIVLYHDNEEIVDQLAQNVVTELNNRQFPARIEEMNAEEAFLGSLPANTWQNVRKPPMHSLNFADLMPATSVWAGPDYIENPYFSENSPPVMFASTTGLTPFRYSPYVGDVGHKLVIGMTGSGKTTHNNFEVTQFLRFPDAQVFAIDREYGLELTTVACGGLHLDLANNDGLAFCPLAHIHEEGEKISAAEWIETCLILQGVTVGAPQRQAIFRALEIMETEEKRTLTTFVSTVQDKTVSGGMTAYTLERDLGWLFDAEQDLTLDSHLVTFDIGKLMEKGDKYLIPALLNIFHLINRRLHTGRPTYIPIDEGWMTFLKARFEEQFMQWLRTCRAKNAAVTLITQSLADLNQSKYRDQILQMCPTRIFLPDAAANSTLIRPLYAGVGLNVRAIQMLSEMIPKQDYLYVSPSGVRPYQLGLGSIALAICGRVGDENRRQWKALQSVDPECYVAAWIGKCGTKEGARQWREIKQREILERELAA